MPTLVSLRPQIHAVQVGDDMVFLDIVADGYFCLPAGAARAQLEADRRSLTLHDTDSVALLCDSGLVEAFSRPGVAAPQGEVVAAERSALSAAFGPPAWLDCLEGAYALWDLHRAYHGLPFAAILAAADAGTRLNPPAPSAALEVEVARFHRWSPYAPVAGKCLLRSFMLLRLLRRKNLDALWVFGVRTWPFHAHCWLQAGDLVLDDQADRVAAYTPILVI